MTETALIIGASGGIGLELTRQYLLAGWNVHGTSRAGASSSAFDVLQEKPIVHQLDVRDQSQINAMAEAIALQPIDVLIFAAGAYDGSSPMAGRGTTVEPEVLFSVNAEAPMAIAEAVYPNLKASNRGRMVFLSSMEAIRRFRPPLRTAYQKSKAALNDDIQRYAPVWDIDGVIGIALHPGWVRTNVGGPNAPITPEHSAAGIRWIVDEMGPEHNGGFYNYRGQRLPW